MEASPDGRSIVRPVRASPDRLGRTVSSDFMVPRALYQELQYRGIRNVGDIALATERDTLYARLISRYFNNCERADPVSDGFTVTKFVADGDDSPLVRAVLVPAITYGTTVGLQYLHINV
jgi:hypothetical protein